VGSIPITRSTPKKHAENRHFSHRGLRCESSYNKSKPVQPCSRLSENSMTLPNLQRLSTWAQMRLITNFRGPTPASDEEIPSQSVQSGTGETTVASSAEEGEPKPRQTDCVSIFSATAFQRAGAFLYGIRDRSENMQAMSLSDIPSHWNKRA